MLYALNSTQTFIYWLLLASVPLICLCVFLWEATRGNRSQFWKLCVPMLVWLVLASFWAGRGSVVLHELPTDDGGNDIRF